MATFKAVEIPRLFKDSLGWLMEKDKPVRKRIALAIIIAISAYIIWQHGFHSWLVIVAIIFWIIGLFMSGLLIFNLFKEYSSTADKH